MCWDGLDCEATVGADVRVGGVHMGLVCLKFPNVIEISLVWDEGRVKLYGYM